MKAEIVALLFTLSMLTSVRAQDETQRWQAFSKQTFPRLTHRNPPEVRRDAVRSFASEDYGAAAEFLAGLFDDRRVPPSLKLEAVKVLEAYQSEGAWKAIEKAAQAARGGKYIIQAYIRKGKPESRAFLLNLVKTAKSPSIQALAIEGIASLPASEITDEYNASLLAWVTNPHAYHGARRAAARALGHVPRAANIPVLIEQLNDPLIREDARDSLLRLTGEEHWDRQQEWKIWWGQIQAANAAYQPRPIDPKIFDEKFKKLSERDKDAVQALFYGRKLEGKNILFLLDNSGSMMQDDRIGRLKNELDAMVSSLTENYGLGFVVFPKNNIPGRDFDKATEDYKERVLEFVDDLQPSGGTPMVEAIEYAFKKVVPRNGIDTIYLLSDGQPTDLEAGDVLTDIILRLNEEYGSRINTIFIGEDPLAQALMEQVAKDSGGSFFAVP